MSQNPNQPLPCPSFFFAQSAAYIRQNHESVRDTVLTKRTSAQKPSRLRVFEIEFYETLVVRSPDISAGSDRRRCGRACASLDCRSRCSPAGFTRRSIEAGSKANKGASISSTTRCSKRRRLDGPDLLVGQHVGQSVYFERELSQCVLRDGIARTKRIVFLAQAPRSRWRESAAAAWFAPEAPGPVATTQTIQGRSARVEIREPRAGSRPTQCSPEDRGAQPEKQ